MAPRKLQLKRNQTLPQVPFNKTQTNLSPLYSLNTLCKLNLFGHNCNPFRMDGTQTHILKDIDQVGPSYLEHWDHGAWEPQTSFKIQGDISRQL